mmetsp:Transcript_13054/g.30481  ORF Transcript_13054/g.30481 Transcript_13054/m.30481 type:complete len:207 (+) Transcript_13054:1673-2293(+)
MGLFAFGFRTSSSCILFSDVLSFVCTPKAAVANVTGGEDSKPLVGDSLKLPKAVLLKSLVSKLMSAFIAFSGMERVSAVSCCESSSSPDLLFSRRFALSFGGFKPPGRPKRPPFGDSLGGLRPPGGAKRPAFRVSLGTLVPPGGAMKPFGGTRPIPVLAPSFFLILILNFLFTSAHSRYSVIHVLMSSSFRSKAQTLNSVILKSLA